MTISGLFGSKIIGDSFQLYSFSHFIMLFILFVSTIVLYVFRQRFIQKGKEHIIRLSLAYFLLATELSLYGWYLYTGVWNPVDSLPLQLCSISLLLSIVMLLTRNHVLFEITYFLGVGGAIQAIVTPELGYDFPHYRYFHFFLAHIAIILASFYMIWFEGLRPTFKSVLKAFTTLNVIALFVFIVNQVTDGNYMFLSRKPSNPSIIDFLGPYPWYILSLELVAFVIFCLLYVPFLLKRKIDLR